MGVKQLQGQDFICIKLNIDLTQDGKPAKLIFDDGNYNVLYSQNYVFTDFPLDEITFFYQNDVLYLPQES